MKNGYYSKTILAYLVFALGYCAYICYLVFMAPTNDFQAQIFKFVSLWPLHLFNFIGGLALIVVEIIDISKRAFKLSYQRAIWLFAILCLNPFGVAAYYIIYLRRDLTGSSEDGTATLSTF